MLKNLMINHSVRRGVERAGMFRPQAKYIFEKIVKSDATIATMAIEEQRTTREFMGVMMSIGSEITRNKYIFTGVVIGAVGTLTTLNIMKNRRKA